MDHIVLKKLVKKELLQSIWLEIDKLVSNYSKLKRTQFGQEISGNHSWYSGALNEGEDIQLSSLVRIFGQLTKDNSKEEKIPFDKIFSDKILNRGQLLSDLTITKEENLYLPEFIKPYADIFKEIKNNLTPLYREGRLGDRNLEQGYEELAEILQKMESEKNG